jgi:hypothetical protein
MLKINPRKQCVGRPRKGLPGLGCIPVRHLLLTVMVALAGLPPGASFASEAIVPRLSVDNSLATAGFYRLSWEPGDERIELQEATEPGFIHPATAYTGPDRATVISGKPDGTWFYRIRALDSQGAGAWSAPLAVTVAHHSLARAFLFLGLGVTVFIATVLMIVRGPDRAA